MQSFTVSHELPGSQARSGVLVYSSEDPKLALAPIETPAICLTTCKGMPSNLTPDLLQTLSLRAVQVAGTHLVKQPDTSLIQAHGDGAHGYLGIPKTHPIFCTTRDPSQYEFHQSKGVNASKGLTVQLHCGRVQLTDEMWSALQSSLRPQMIQSLADEVPMTSNFQRQKQAVTRSLQWLDSHLQSQPSPSSSTLWASLSGGLHAQLWKESAEEASKRGDKVGGFVLCGLGTGELPEERAQTIKECCSHLPKDKPRMVPAGLSGPEEILEAVEGGVDVIVSDYASRCSLNGYALCFPTSVPTEAESEAAGGSLKMYDNLWDVKFAREKTPLVAGCSCFACTRHNQAYVHHLLECHEMLADVLLDLHNLHHMSLFMKSVRDAIAQGPEAFQRLKKRFCA